MDWNFESVSNRNLSFAAKWQLFFLYIGVATAHGVREYSWSSKHGRVSHSVGKPSSSPGLELFLIPRKTGYN